MFRPRPALPRPSRISRLNRPVWDSHSTFNFRLSTSFSSYSYALFCTAQNRNPFYFKYFRTLCAKHPGWGVPSFSANSVPAALKPTRGSAPADPFDALHRSSASALESTTTQPSATIASKELTPKLNPLDATLTKKQGEGPLARNHLDTRLPAVAGHSRLMSFCGTRRGTESMHPECLEVVGGSECYSVGESACWRS
jgi:hypothetical protein